MYRPGSPRSGEVVRPTRSPCDLAVTETVTGGRGCVSEPAEAVCHLAPRRRGALSLPHRPTNQFKREQSGLTGPGAAADISAAVDGSGVLAYPAETAATPAISA